MRLELSKASDKSEHDKRLLQADAAAKLLSREKQFKSEVLQLRSELASFEDKYTHAKDDLEESKAQQDSLARMCQQLERSRQTAIDGQEKLRLDISNMQQTLNATYRLER